MRYFFNIVFGLLLGLSVQAQNSLSGSVTGDMTVGGSGETLEISFTVTIEENATLTILPGTTVHFNEWSELVVYGKLIAHGTDSEHIDMMPSPTSGAFFLNHSIRFLNSATADFDFVTLFVWGGGPSILCDASEFIISNSYLYGTNAFVSIENNSMVTISESEFESTGTRSIDVSASELNISSTIFSGTGLYAEASSTISLSDCTIDGKNAYNKYENLLHSEGSSFSITRTAIKNINSEASACYFESSDLQILDCQFSDCYFSDNTQSITAGGAIFFLLGDIEVNKTTFRNCEAEQGGAICAVFPFNMTITSNDFLDNTDAVYVNQAGSLLARDNFFYLNDQTFTIYDVGYALISENTFQENEQSSSSGGGALTIYSSAVDIKDNQFATNKTNMKGGAVSIHDSQVVITGNNFTGNKAEANLQIENYLIAGGGAMFLSQCEAEIHKNTFQQNKSNLKGGALAIYESKSNLSNNLFLENEAVGSGSALEYNYSESPTDKKNFCINNLFYNNKNNSKGGSVAIYSEGTVINIYNSILWGNQAPDGTVDKQIEITLGLKMPIIAHNIIQGGDGGIQINFDVSSKGYVYGNIDENPAFVDPSAENFRIQDTSPAVNSGISRLNNENFVFQSHDFYGNLRQYEGTNVDIGIYETERNINTNDSLALVAIYNATGGENWYRKANWLQGNFDTWENVTFTGGRVTGLSLEANNLIGNFPDEVRHLTSLKHLSAYYNWVFSLPSSLIELKELEYIDFGYNYIWEIPDYSANEFFNLQVLYLDHNRLTFKHLLPNSKIINFIYAPQADVGNYIEKSVNHGATEVLTVNGLIEDQTKITYTWYHDEVRSQKGSEKELSIQNFSIQDTGTYICYVEHSELPLLELKTKPIHLSYIPPSADKNDSLALVAIYRACEGENWTKNNGWLEAGTNLRDWYGVTMEEGRVVGLSLGNNNLSNSVPDEINELTELKSFDVQYNSLDGAFNFDFEKLSKLNDFYINNNNIEGSLPEEISSAPELINFSVASNNLASKLPDGLEKLVKLKTLNISSNKFNANINVIQSLTNLEELKAFNNNFSEELTIDFSQLQNLEEVNLSKNRLWGTFPEFADVVKIIDFSENSFVGVLPGLLSTNLLELDLSSNGFTGTIPLEMTMHYKLQKLILNNNALSGEIPGSLGNLLELQSLRLDHNQFSGEIPQNLEYLSQLQQLNLGFNKLEGEIPQIFHDMPELIYLGLDNNKLSGAIIPEIGLLDNLVTLKLYANQLSGDLPKELGDLAFLEVLEINKNNLTGELPASLGNLAALKTLSIRTNQFEGKLPESFKNLMQLEKFYMYDNYFTYVPDLSGLPNLEAFQIFENYIEFDAIIPNIKENLDFQYSPQRSIDHLRVALAGSDITIGRDIAGEGNIYEWAQGTATMVRVSTDEPYMKLMNISAEDVGNYTLYATNPSAPELEITHFFNVMIDPVKPEVEMPMPYCFGDINIHLETTVGGSETAWFKDENLTEKIGSGSFLDFELTEDQMSVYVVNIISGSYSEVIEIPIKYRPVITVTGASFEANEESGANYTWHHNDMLISNERSIEVTENGKYTVTISLNGCSAVSQAVYWQDGQVTGIENTTRYNDFSIFPNPAQDNLQMEWQDAYNGNVEIEVIDLKGKSLLLKNTTKQTRTLDEEISVEELSPGAYLLILRLSDTTITKQFIKK